MVIQCLKIVDHYCWNLFIVQSPKRHKLSIVGTYTLFVLKTLLSSPKANCSVLKNMDCPESTILVQCLGALGSASKTLE